MTIKSDVFAFAVFMWEMATRMHPWHGLGLIAVCAVPLGPAPATLPSDCGSVCAQLQARRTLLARTNTRARCLAQVVAKVVTQNARLSTELVEQVRRRIVGSLKPGFPLFHLLAWKAKFPEAFVTLMEESWRAGTVPPSPMPEACRRP